MKFLKFVGSGGQGSGHAQSFSPGQQGPSSAVNTLPAVGGGLHPTAYSRHAEVLGSTSGALSKRLSLPCSFTLTTCDLASVTIKNPPPVKRRYARSP
jgi:hypothetical protein